MYSFAHRVRYSECDESGQLGVGAVIDLFQDCAGMHSSDVGLPHSLLHDRGQVWVLGSWQVEILRLPREDEMLTVATYPYDLRGFMGFRNFTLDTQSGERLVIANSDWALIDPVYGRPTRVTEDIPRLYESGERLEIDYKPRKIKLEGEFDALPDEIPVRRHMLDVNGHVNNAQYVRIACDLLPEGFKFTSMRVDYKRPALPGDTMTAKMQRADNRVTIALYNGGVHLVSLEFTCQ